MDQGYIKLWRKSIDSGLIQDHRTWVFWTWCLMKATWKERKVSFNHQLITLMPGQFIYGRKKAAKELNMSEREVRTCLTKLEKTHLNLTSKSTNRFTIISIINWHIYQSDDIENDQQNDQQTTSRRPADDHKQEVKKLKKDKKEPKPLSGKPDSGGFVVPDMIDKDLWKEFMQVRSRLKAVNSDRAKKALLTELRKLYRKGNDPNDMIKLAIEKSWKSVYAPISDNRPKSVQNQIDETLNWRPKNEIGELQQGNGNSEGFLPAVKG